MCNYAIVRMKCTCADCVGRCYGKRDRHYTYTYVAVNYGTTTMYSQTSFVSNEQCTAYLIRITINTSVIYGYESHYDWQRFLSFVFLCHCHLIKTFVHAWSLQCSLYQTRVINSCDIHLITTYVIIYYICSTSCDLLDSNQLYTLQSVVLKSGLHDWLYPYSCIDVNHYVSILNYPYSQSRTYLTITPCIQNNINKQISYIHQGPVS